MSLSGLDDPAIIESYKSALAEAGRWFMLEYISRDSVGLLSKGAGGVVEIRGCINDYHEKSPLYGFVQYRRRKIILSYVPEGISRLLQARISIQFQSILDKFSPYDAIFSFALATELTENALSSACLLHTASNSMTSSNSSVHRQRLGEITEDAEENGPTNENEGLSPSTAGANKRASSIMSEATVVPARNSSKESGASPARSKGIISRQTSDSPEAGFSKPLPAVPRSSGGTRSNLSPQQHLLDHLSQTQTEPRRSSQSTRPSLWELDQISLYKPKVKLGPRPSIDVNGRPRTAGSAVRPEPRPVASLPAGLRSSSSRKQFMSRPRSQHGGPQSSLSSSFSTEVPPIPPLIIPPPIIIGSFSRNLPTSPKSVMSINTVIGITPEKQRLMKALEMRKKQLAKGPVKTEKKDSETSRELKNDGEESAAKGDQETSMTASSTNGPPQPNSSEDAGLTAHGERSIDTKQQAMSLENRSELPSISDILAHNSATEKSQQESHAKSEISQENGGPSIDPPTEVSLDEVAASEEVSIEPPPRSEMGKLNDESNSTTETEKDEPVGGQTPQPEEKTETQDAEKQESNGSITDQPKPESVQEDDVEPIRTSTASQVAEKFPTPTSMSSVGNESDLVSKPSVHADNSSQSSVVEEKQDLVKESHPPARKSAEISFDATIFPTRIMTSHYDDSNSSPGLSTPRAAGGFLDMEEEDDTSNDTGSMYNLPIQDPKLDQEKQVNFDADNKKVAPIRTSVATVESDVDTLLSDDSLLEGLDSATVEEARPVTVPKSPLGNGDAGSSTDRWKGSRIVSSQSAQSTTGSDIQALPAGSEPDGPPVLVAKKVNVSSGISKRIKALEMFTSREPGSSPPPPGPPATRPDQQSKATSPSAFDKFRKRASLSQPQSPVAKSPSISSVASPTSIKRFDSISSNKSFNNKQNSVSVIARIVRDSATSPEPADTSDPSRLNLQRSDITVERNSESRPRTSTSTMLTPEQRLSASSSSGSKANSNSGATSGYGNFLTTSRSSTHPRFEPGHSPSSSGNFGHLDSVSEAKEGVKESRKSRIIRRMSSITSNSRRNIKHALNPLIKEEDRLSPQSHTEEIQSPTLASTPTSPTTRIVVTPEPSSFIEIGEMNIQFPDTLFWKRRVMRVNDNGFLVLTPSTIDVNTRNNEKRYHLSEFAKPCLPDQDREELPNSILLDFHNGNTLQCACESRQGQMYAFQALVDAHKTYTSQ